MQKITQSQLVLLTILVAFVVSIATTIISMALLSDSPIAITQITNNVTKREQFSIQTELDKLKAEIIAELNEVPEPEVSGVIDVAEFDNKKMAEMYSDLFADPYIALSQELQTAVNGEPVDHSSIFGGQGVYELVVGDLIMLHSAEFEHFGSSDLLVSDDVFIYNMEHGSNELSTIVSLSTDNPIESQYNLVRAEVPGCLAGNAVFDINSDLIGVCVSENQAITGFSWVIDAVDSMEITNDVE